MKNALGVSHAARTCWLVVWLIAASAGAHADDPAKAPSPGEPTAVATFAGGCFWSMEHPFDELVGVVSTTTGYTGGRAPNPTYKEVSTGGTGHAESVQVTYDPSKVSYEKLLDVFWHNIDPLDGTGQFCDKGRQYRSAIFVRNDAERQTAEQSKQALQRSGRLRGSVVTESPCTRRRRRR